MEIKNKLPQGIDHLQEALGKKSQKTEKQKSLESDAQIWNSNNKDYNVSLSQKSKDTLQLKQKAFDIAKNTDPINYEKVKRIQEQMKNNEYKVDSEKIADAMLLEAVKDKIAIME